MKMKMRNRVELFVLGFMIFEMLCYSLANILSKDRTEQIKQKHIIRILEPIQLWLDTVFYRISVQQLSVANKDINPHI